MFRNNPARPRKVGRRVYLPLFLVALCGLAGGRGDAAPQIDDHALVRITSYAGARVQTGTGFLISSGNVVTAYHVVLASQRIDIELGGKVYKDVEVVCVRPEADLALLHADGLPTSSFYRIKQGPTAQPGSPIYVHGHPLGFDNQLLVGHLTQSGFLLSENWVDRGGQGIFEAKGLRLVPIDITSEPGVSGAPVLDDQGVAFGVFSGSLQIGGAGYSWAVPLLYAEPAQMQPIHRRASAIAHWAPFPYLRSGLSLLRSLDTESELARLALRCRERIDAYATAWETQVGAATSLQLKLATLKPRLGTSLDPNSPQDPTTTLRTLKLGWSLASSNVQAFIDAQSKFDAAGGQMIAACVSQTAVHTLIPELPPGTRQNVLFDRAIGKQMLAAENGLNADIAQHKELDQAADAIRKELFEIGATADVSHEEGQIKAVRRFFGLIESLVTGLLSEEQADYIETGLRHLRAVPEILEAIELHQWEREFPTYTYHDSSGLLVTLPKGWLVLDHELREATGVTSQVVPEYVQFIQIGVSHDKLPLAFGEIAWQATDPTQSFASDTQRSEEADHRWHSLQVRDEFTAVNSKRSERQVGADVVQEITGDAQASGMPLRAYAATRFNRRGTASVNCMLLSTTVDYESCSQLMDALRLPH